MSWGCRALRGHPEDTPRIFRGAPQGQLKDAPTALGCLWVVLGMSLGCPWVVLGMSLGCPWDVLGMS
eukprot:2382433-Lingulodinium_polyedra.AAC.1